MAQSKNKCESCQKFRPNVGIENGQNYGLRLCLADLPGIISEDEFTKRSHASANTKCVHPELYSKK